MKQDFLWGVHSTSDLGSALAVSKLLGVDKGVAIAEGPKWFGTQLLERLSQCHTTIAEIRALQPNPKGYKCQVWVKVGKQLEPLGSGLLSMSSPAHGTTAAACPASAASTTSPCTLQSECAEES